MYSTDNGPHMNSWPRRTTLFRSEKTRLGGRVPGSDGQCAGRARSSRADLERDHQDHDWFPTFLAMAGDPDVAEKLKPAIRRSVAPRSADLDADNPLPWI